MVKCASDDARASQHQYEPLGLGLLPKLQLGTGGWIPSLCPKDSKPAKTAGSSTPEGLNAPRGSRCIGGMGAHTQPTARRGNPRPQDTLATFQAVCPGETHFRTPKEALVLYTEIVNQIARRLPHRTRRDVSEITDMIIEYWRAELAAGQTVNIPGIGKLQIDRQTDGRVYGRFRPTNELKEQKRHE